MAGNKMGYMKSKTGFGKPSYKVGSMITRMNKMAVDESREGESLKHEKSETKSFEKKENKSDKKNKGLSMSVKAL